MYASVCMLCMICMILTLKLMILTLGLLWNYVCNSECENNVLHQQLPNLSFEYFKIGVSGARASDVVPLIDDQTIGWSPWSDTRAHYLLLNFYFATACMIHDVFVCFLFTLLCP